METFIPDLSVDRLVPSATNPRTIFDDAKLHELAESIKAHGIIQPIVVRPIPDSENYEIVAGERRYRASLLAERTWIPALSRELNDGDVLEIQVLENNQRQDVTELEECIGFRRILDTGRYGEGTAAVDALAGKLGRSRRYVYARLQLDRLTDEAKQELRDGNITASHAILLASLGPEIQADGIGKLLYRQVWDNKTNQYMRGTVRLDPDERTTSTRDLRNHLVAKNINLSKVAFMLDDADLLPEAGACTTCPFRSGNHPEYEPGADGANPLICLNQHCASKKADAVGVMLRERHAREGLPLVVVSGTYGNAGKGILTRNSFEWTTAATKGAELAICVEGTVEDRGHVRHIKRYEMHKNVPSAAQELADLKRERDEKVEALYRKNLFDATHPSLPTRKTDDFLRDYILGAYPDQTILSDLEFLGIACKNASSVPKVISELSIAEMLRILMLHAIGGRQTFISVRWYEATVLTQWATAAKVDLSAARTWAESEVPPIEEPKPKEKEPAKLPEWASLLVIGHWLVQSNQGWARISKVSAAGNDKKAVTVSVLRDNDSEVKNAFVLKHDVAGFYDTSGCRYSVSETIPTADVQTPAKNKVGRPKGSGKKQLAEVAK